MRGTLVVCADYESVCREAARRVAAALAADGERQGRVSVALAGGETPRRLYEVLASEEFRGRIPWTKVHFFWGDERLVPLDHRESNYRLAWEALLERVPVPAANLHPVAVQAAPAEAAARYERELRSFFRVRPFGFAQGKRGIPAFDLILLGVGADGHTASLFPGSPALAERKRLVVAVEKPREGMEAVGRVTLTLPVFNAARRVFFLVSGEAKAEALAAAIEGASGLLARPAKVQWRGGGPAGQAPPPAGQVAPRKGELVWLADAAAASKLKRVRVETQ